MTAIRSAFLGPVPAGDDPNRILGYDFSFAIGRELEVEEPLAA